MVYVQPPDWQLTWEFEERSWWKTMSWGDVQTIEEAWKLYAAGCGRKNLRIGVHEYVFRMFDFEKMVQVRWECTDGKRKPVACKRIRRIYWSSLWHSTGD